MYTLVPLKNEKWVWLSLLRVCVCTVGVNIKFPYRREKKTLSYGVPTFKKNITVYRFYGVYTLTIFSRHFPSNSAQTHQLKSRSNRRTRVKLARREAINRREEHKQSTD